jgi:hypothetical protein
VRRVKTKAKAKLKPAAKAKAKPAAPAKLPAVVKKPARPTRPSLPLPPPPPAPPPLRVELAAPPHVGRLLHYGEKLGARRIDTRMLPTLRLPVSSGAIALFDPGVPKTWKVLDRPTGAGVFGVMLSIAKAADPGKPDALAAITIHLGRGAIARWTFAHVKGGKPPKSDGQAPRWPVTTGWIALADAGDVAPGPVAVPASGGIEPIAVPLTDGRQVLAVPCTPGDYAAYWAVDVADKPVCLVIDFEVFTQKDWKEKKAKP